MEVKTPVRLGWKQWKAEKTQDPLGQLLPRCPLPALFTRVLRLHTWNFCKYSGSLFTRVNVWKTPRTLIHCIFSHALQTLLVGNKASLPHEGKHLPTISTHLPDVESGVARSYSGSCSVCTFAIDIWQDHTAAAMAPWESPVNHSFGSPCSSCCVCQ